MQAPPRKVIIAVITEGRSDMTLQTCVSILNLQMVLMTSNPADGFQADLRFFKTINQALTAMHNEKDVCGLYVINFSTGVAGDFATKALASDKDVIVGIHPLASVDWDRVKANITNTSEELQNTGMVYNISLGGLPDKNGYAKVKSINEASIMFVKRNVVDEIVKNHPSVASSDGNHYSLFLEGVYDGVYMSGVDRFVKLYGKTIYGDTVRSAIKIGSQDYVGVVGNRSQLR